MTAPPLPRQLRRPTFAEVDLGAVAQNVQRIRDRVGPQRGVMAMVKADGYGHGAVPVARTALENGADWLGVALPEEGWILRRNGISAPILVLGPVFPEQAGFVLDSELALGVFSWDVARALNDEAGKRGRKAFVHIKVDTGMGRIGVRPEESISFIESLRKLPHLTIQGIYTHLAEADHEDKSHSRRQIETFLDLCVEAESRGISIPMKHLSNSAAVLDLPEAFQNLVRPGIMIYGCYPSQQVRREVALLPAMSWRTRIAFVKDLTPGDSVSYGRTFVAERPMRVATLPLGYGDGFSRQLSNRGEVLVREQRARVVGIVCMDMTMVDVTHVAGAAAGDEVVIFGRQGAAEVPVEEVAQRAGTISYEILCGVGRRVPRLYRGGKTMGEGEESR